MFGFSVVICRRHHLTGRPLIVSQGEITSPFIGSTAAPPGDQIDVAPTYPPPDGVLTSNSSLAGEAVWRLSGHCLPKHQRQPFHCHTPLNLQH